MKVSKNFGKITPEDYAKARNSVRVDIKERIQKLK